MSHLLRSGLLSVAALAAIAAMMGGLSVSQEKPPVADPSTEGKIRAALDQPTAFNFEEVPLSRVMVQLAEKHKIQIVADLRGLEDAGVVPEDLLITRKVDGLRLRSALQLTLGPVGLTWVIRNEVLEITSRDVASNRLVTKVYPVKDLMIVRDELGEIDADDVDSEALIDAIENNIVPDSWVKSGGPGSCSALRGTLVVRQTAAVHHQIGQLVRSLRHAVKQQADAKGPARYAAIPCQDEAEARAQQAIRKSLQKRVSLKYVEKPLSAVAAEIAKEHGPPVFLDRRALEDFGIVPEDLLISAKYDDLSLQSALNLLLETANLDWIIRDDVLLITSKDEAEQYLTLRVYPVEDLVDQAELREVAKYGEVFLFDSLIESITSTVLPESWTEAGGPACVDSVDGLRCLVCSQSRQGHAGIEEMLAKVREAIATAGETTDPEKQRQAAAEQFSLRVYYLPPTMADGGEAKTIDGVVTLIKELVAPESWKAKDTPELKLIMALPDRIVVRQTGRVHREIRRLLKKLGLDNRQWDDAERGGPGGGVLMPVPVVGDAPMGFGGAPAAGPAPGVGPFGK